MPTTREEARIAKIKLKETFATASALRKLDATIDLGRDNEGYYVQAKLWREPTPAEKAALPTAADRVRVKYDITGTTKP